jgi:uncharacterized protein YlxW (UPF0749 family)
MIDVFTLLIKPSICIVKLKEVLFVQLEQQQKEEKEKKKDEKKKLQDELNSLFKPVQQLGKGKISKFKLFIKYKFIPREPK